MNKIQKQILKNQETIMYALVRILTPMAQGDNVDPIMRKAYSGAIHNLIENYESTRILFNNQ